jgi:thiol-disulfide isomerase/thioredoxin
MKKTTLIAVLLFMAMASSSVARQGYRIHLKMPDVKDSVVFLAHYYGKSLPTIYKRDSARFDKNGNAEFVSTDSSFVGGIYMMLLSDHKTYFEFLISAGEDISITAYVSKLPDGIKFKNSPENERFQDYVSFLKKYQAGQQALQKEYSESKTAEDSAAIRKKAIATSKDLTNYRRDYAKKYPNTLLSTIFNALEVPEVPTGDHFLEDGKTKDSTFAYKYYKKHFWDGFNFRDDRLIYTPIYDAKLEEYMNKMVLPWPDSVEHESDMLLKKAKGTKDMFKYTLWWLTKNAEESKVMGMDEAFVYIVENYYMKGDAFWLTNEELSKYLDRAQKIAPNVIGNLAPEIKLPNIITKKEVSMKDMKAKYTLIVFYSPTCGHCQHEMPSLDSLYKAVLKNKGVKIYTVATEGEEKAIVDFIKKYNMEEWTNTWDNEHVGDWRGKYDVYSTPTIYLLDDKKIIKGKRLDHSNIGNLIEMVEKKSKDKEKNG